MTKDEILQMAREAHRELVTIDYPGHIGQLDEWTIQLMIRFSHLVEQRTREECAKICEDTEQEYEPYIGTPRNLAYTCADAIRATSTLQASKVEGR